MQREISVRARSSSIVVVCCWCVWSNWWLWVRWLALCMLMFGRSQWGGFVFFCLIWMCCVILIWFCVRCAADSMVAIVRCGSVRSCCWVLVGCSCSMSWDCSSGSFISMKGTVFLFFWKLCGGKLLAMIGILRFRFFECVLCLRCTLRCSWGTIDLMRVSVKCI